MIRPATHDDLPRVLEMGERFFDTAGWDDVAEWDQASVRKTLEGLIEGDAGCLFVAEAEGGLVGMTGGLVYPFYFDHGHITGQELFWWVEPEHRGVGGALLDAMETWAKEAGAKSFAMIALDKINPDLMGRVYRRRGYRPSEHSYIRRL